jgi:hypothetical protein
MEGRVRIQYLAQPGNQIGAKVTELLKQQPPPVFVAMVYAFANRQTLLRYRSSIAGLKQLGTSVRIVVGIDMDSTSKEALEEIVSWGVDARVVKNGVPRHTFHPKLCLTERKDYASILIGSSNLTEGGFFRNYEACALITYDLPADQAEFNSAKSALARFLDASGPTCCTLSLDLIARLVQRGEVPTESEARARRKALGAMRRRKAPQGTLPIFGTEQIDGPPPFSPEVIRILASAAKTKRKRQRQARNKRKSPAVRSPIEIRPTAFYMTLPKMRGSIPGEPRVPLVARDIAEQFWGWPDNYRLSVGPRGGRRKYRNWKPLWRILDSENPAATFLEPVRMYEYEESADFRFYSARLLALGADQGDIVRIARVSDTSAEFECVLARKGTPTHTSWQHNCTEPVRNSSRRWGYA